PHLRHRPRPTHRRPRRPLPPDPSHRNRRSEPRRPSHHLRLHRPGRQLRRLRPRYHLAGRRPQLRQRSHHRRLHRPGGQFRCFIRRRWHLRLIGSRTHHGNPSPITHSLRPPPPPFWILSSD